MGTESDSTKRVTDISYIINGEGEADDAIRAPGSRLSKPTKLLTITKPSAATSTTTPSTTEAMEDVTPTSPSAGDPMKKDAAMEHKRKRAPSVTEGTLSPAPQTLVSKSETGKGSAYNPIVLEEYSPRRKTMLLPKRQDSSQEPSKIQHERRITYMSRPRRTALTQKSANAGMSTSKTSSASNDVPPTVNAKAAAVTGPPLAQQGKLVPFEVQYPLSARFLAQRQALQAQQQTLYTPTFTHMGTLLNSSTEDLLRQKALWYIREHSRPQPFRKILAADLDETSASETEHPISDRKTGATASSPVKTKKMSVYQDPSDLLTPLIAQSSLVHSLLNIYPRSTNKKGLREDISMLLSVQNQNVHAWMNAESRKRRRIEVPNEGSRIGKVSHAAQANKKDQAANNPEQVKKDDEMRTLLSAGAGMWQAGTDEALPEVFATRARSTNGDDMEE
jgi:hypothetical protein